VEEYGVMVVNREDESRIPRINLPEFVDRPETNEKLYQIILISGLVAGVFVAVWHLVVWASG